MLQSHYVAEENQIRFFVHRCKTDLIHFQGFVNKPNLIFSNQNHQRLEFMCTIAMPVRKLYSHGLQISSTVEGKQFDLFDILIRDILYFVFSIYSEMWLFTLSCCFSCSVPDNSSITTMLQTTSFPRGGMQHHSNQIRRQTLKFELGDLISNIRQASYLECSTISNRHLHVSVWKCSVIWKTEKYTVLSQIHSTKGDPSIGIWAKKKRLL